MTSSPECAAYVKAWERLRLRAYRDGGGVPTIGYGMTRGVVMGDTCTAEQAEQWLNEELENVSDDVSALIFSPIEQNQFDALISLVYNIGITQFAGSTLLKKVNAAEHAEATCEFLRWSKDNGRFVRGLMARRCGEGLMYSRGQYDAR